MDVSATQVALLCVAALCGGTLDAIAGGGGLITVPALLAAGLPPHAALGTNKGQSSFGSLAAILRYRRAGLIDAATARVAFPAGLAGSAAGTALTFLIRPDVLRPVVLALLVVVGVLLASGWPRPREPGGAPVRQGARVLAIALVLGAYDGFFGPGTGTFIIAAFAAWVHLPLTRATANAKVLNFGSNVAALAVFAYGGAVVWKLAVPMAIAQILGGSLGAHLAIRRGDRLIRGLVLVVVLGMVLWVAKDLRLGAGPR